MKIVDRNMIVLPIRERKKGNYNRSAHPPHYLPRVGFFVCVFQKDIFKVLGDSIRLSLGRNITRKYGVRFLEFKLPSHIRKRINEVRDLTKVWR